MADGALNTMQDIRIRMKRKDLQDLKLEEYSEIDYEAMDFLEKNAGTGFCLREKEDFDWITTFPWIKAGSEKDSRLYSGAVGRDRSQRVRA